MYPEGTGVTTDSVHRRGKLQPAETPAKILYMKHLKPILMFAGLLAGAMFLAPDEPRAADPPKEPAHLAISVSPDTVAPGGAARVTLRIQPKDGVKINRYPKIKLQVPEQEGLAEASSAEIGNDRPPPPDQMDTNYYKVVDPVEIDLKLADGVSAGRHELDARITYFYCVTASGFCAPARLPIKIPVVVR